MSRPWTRHCVFVVNWTKIHVGGWFQMCVFWSCDIIPSVCLCGGPGGLLPSLACPRTRAKPHITLRTWSCRCSHVNFSLPRSGFSCNARLEIVSFAMAYCTFAICMLCPAAWAPVWLLDCGYGVKTISLKLDSSKNIPPHQTEQAFLGCIERDRYWISSCRIDASAYIIYMDTAGY